MPVSARRWAPGNRSRDRLPWPSRRSWGVPASWSRPKRDKALAGVLRPTGAPDVDNMLKVIDGLHGIVFENDSQIVEAKISKSYGENPLLRIEISEAEKTGLL